MKLEFTTLLLFSLLSGHIASQNVTEAFSYKGNIYAQDGKIYFHQVTKSGLDTLPSLSKDRHFLIYLRHQQSGEINLTQIIRYDLRTSTEEVLVQASEDNPNVSTSISYANSDNYPFSCLGDIMNMKLSPDNERIYFETTAWTVSHAIHYYVISTGQIYFFHSGDLNEIYPNGMLNIQTTDLAFDKKGNSARYVQYWLYDSDGKKIKPLSKRIF